MELNIILNLFLILFITINIVDISGIQDSINKYARRYFKTNAINIHLCSYCINWWLSIFYLLITGHFTLEYVALTLCFSFLSTTIEDIQFGIKDLITKIMNKIL